MLNIPSSKPTQFRANSVNTITRINSLIKNLDLKLERLCCQNLTSKRDSSLSESLLIQLKNKANSKEERLRKVKTDFEYARNNESVVKHLHNQRQQVAVSESESGEVAGDSESIDSTPEGNNSIYYRNNFEKICYATASTNLTTSNSYLSVKGKSPLPEAKKRSESDPVIVTSKSLLNKTNSYKESDEIIKQQTFQNNTGVKQGSKDPICENLKSFEKDQIVATSKSVRKGRVPYPSVAKNKTTNEFSVNQIKTILRLRSGGCNRFGNQRLAIHLAKTKNMNIIPSQQMQTKKLSEETPDTGVVQLKTLSNIYRAKVIDAYRNRQIFTVFGNYGTIRRALLKRGWLEKLPRSRYPKLQSLPEDVLLQHAKRGNEYETVAISKIINHFPAFFVWQPKGLRDMYADVQPYRNRIRRTHMLDFSTKVGLIGCAEQQLWYRQEGVAGMLYPRFFRLGPNQEEQMAFIDDFRMTQCRSLLRYLIKSFEKPEDVIDYENGSVSSVIVHFAVGRARRQADEWENVLSLDTEQSQIPDAEWNDFMLNSSKIINQQQKLKCTYRDFAEFLKTSRAILARIDEKRPDYKWDGYKNLWILKPGYQSRGLGIIIRNNIDDILRWSTSHSSRRYIVQKYIEQPLLIYRTKFDIRQYMLVFIRESTVQIWLYKDCYLRFSSQEYSIDDLREVVHLTNNSVQKRYKNKATRDPHLPKCNMWSLDQFKAYLKTQSHADDMWDARVFVGFRENLIAVVMASLDETNLSENSFELYGCDFMLDEQYNPILIEINSTPDMSPSTEVTARICPMVMQDCIKVIVDLPRNSRALTGQFRLIYEVNYKFKQDLNLKDGLNISGKSMELCRRERMAALRPKRNIKMRKNEIVSAKKQPAAREGHTTTTPSVQYKKSKSSKVANVGQNLKAATKEALALRYTIPK